MAVCAADCYCGGGLYFASVARRLPPSAWRHLLRRPAGSLLDPAGEVRTREMRPRGLGGMGPERGDYSDGQVGGGRAGMWRLEGLHGSSLLPAGGRRRP